MSIFCPTLEQPRYTLRQQQAARDLPRAAAAAAPATEAAAYHTGWIALTPGVVRARLRGQLRERGRAGSVLAPCPMRTLFLTGKRRMLLKMRRIRMRTRRVNVPPLPPPTMHCIVSSEAQASRPEAAAAAAARGECATSVAVKLNGNKMKEMMMTRMLLHHTTPLPAWQLQWTLHHAPQRAPHPPLLSAKN